MDWRFIGLVVVWILALSDARSVRVKRSFPVSFLGAATANRQRNYYFKPYGARDLGTNIGPSNGGSNSGSNSGGSAQTGPAQTMKASCDVIPNPSFAGMGSLRGSVDLTQTEGADIQLAVKLVGFGISTHALIIHQTGKISGSCENAGGQYNPKGLALGNSNARYAGDLGEVGINSSGQISKDFSVTETTLFGMESIVGRTISIHQNTDPTGTGVAMACCVIYRAD